MVESLFKWLVVIAFLLLPQHPSAGSLKPFPDHSGFHPFFVSVTEIAHNQKENTVEISCKLFADDFENTLKAQYKTAVDLTNPKDPKQAEKIVTDYMVKHLKLSIDAKPVMLQFVGYEKENEAVWCYMQVNGISAARKLEVTNTLLYEMFDSQIGIIHASVNGNRKSMRLVNPDARAAFEF